MDIGESFGHNLFVDSGFVANKCDDSVVWVLSKLSDKLELGLLVNARKLQRRIFATYPKSATSTGDHVGRHGQVLYSVLEWRFKLRYCLCSLDCDETDS